MPVIHVDNAADARLADFRDLTDVALRRSLGADMGLYMAEGEKVISRALEAGHRPRAVLVSERWLPGVHGKLSGAGHDVPMFVAPMAVLEEITGYHVHRGALASMERPPLPTVAELVEQARLVVVLEGIVDHTNVGAIFRSAAALGADAVIVDPTCADPLYRRSVKVSMGTVFQVPWTRAERWPRQLDDLRAAGFTVAALALAEGGVSLADFAARRHDRVALILGAEGDGLSGVAMEQADVAVTIPMAGGVDSLNVAAASAVAVWALRSPT